MIVDRCSN